MNHYETLVNKQRDYFYKGSTKDIRFRMAMLYKLKQAIIINEDKIAKALKEDLGKSKHEAIMTEIGFTLAEINTMMKGLKSWSRVKRKGTNITNFPAKSYTIREPFGLTLIIGPWNYPFQLLMAPLVGAIAGGNCAILKPSELTVHTAQVVEDIITENFKSEYIAVVQGGIPETEALLAQRYDKIFFTGSTTVGSIVMNRASKHLTPVILELGGKSPTIVDHTANLKLAAKRIVFGKGINSGQTCVAPDYVLVHESVKEAFYSESKKATKAMYGENQLNNPDYGRMLNDKNYQRVKGYMADGTIINGGFTDDDKLHIDLTLMEVNDLDAPIMKDEIFGPILPVVTYSGYDEMINIIRRNPDPLALYVFSRNKKFVKRLLHDVPFGGGCINDTVMHLTNDYLPFGGRGTSGTGNYHGKHSFEAFTHEKAVLRSITLVDLPLRYPPFKDSFLKIVKKLMY